MTMSKQSDADDWHRVTFDISIDKDVEWDDFDLKKWSHNLARFTAFMMAKTTMTPEELEHPENIRTLIMGTKIYRVEFATDKRLHQLIDDTDDSE